MTTQSNALRIASAIKATMKKNPEASVCEVLRAVAYGYKKAGEPIKRADFLEAAANWVTEGTASRQFYEGIENKGR